MDHSSFHNYMPHGHCYLWQPALVGIHVISDMLIGTAYLGIAIALYILIKKTKISYSPIVLAFGVFIGACGLTHFLEIWNLWNADYWLGGWVKAITASASVYTCVVLIRTSPKLVELAAAVGLSEERRLKLEEANVELDKRVKDRTLDLQMATERERAAKEHAEALYLEAQNANRAKDEFLATMSHELRTPLSVILGYSELLIDGELADEEKTQAVATIHRNAQTQSQLVNDLLDVSMILSGKIQLNLKVVDLKEVCDDAIESVALAAKAKGIQISLNEDNRIYLVSGDSTRLQQIIWNLLTNAIKFTNKGGLINVTLTIKESYCQIQVLDSGIGIDPMFLPHAFDRFSQEDASSNRKFGGLGLGLGIVRHFTELHGGTVEVTSQGKEKGSCFTLSLPLASISAVPAQTEASVKLQKNLKEQLKGVRALIIDDEADIRLLLETFLQKQGLATTSVSNAIEALAKYSSFKPDVIICDIGMPEIDGYTLMTMIRDQELKSGGYVPAIALTAYAQEGVRNKAITSGFQSYLTKPANSIELLYEIARLIKN